MENYSFDLVRIFIGDTPPLLLVEILLRTTIMFAYSLLLFRVIGARTLSQLSLGESVLIIALGAAMGDPMFYPNVPLLQGMFVITVVVFLQRGLTLLSIRSKAIQRLTEPHTIRLIHNGEIEHKGLVQAGLTLNELFAELRQLDIDNLADVRRAYLEPDGNFSAFRTDGAVHKVRTYDLIEDADQLKSA